MKLFGSLDGGRAQSVPIVNGHTEALHERPRVLAEPLLPRDQGSPWCAYSKARCFEIVRDPHVVVRTENQASAFAREKFAKRLDLFRGRFLFRDQMIQAEYHQGVRVGEHALSIGNLCPA